MSQTLVTTLPVESGGALRFLHALVSALYEARARQARREIARHAGLVLSARQYRLVLDARSRERRHA